MGATHAYECVWIYVHVRRQTQEDRSLSKFNDLNSRLGYPLLTLETKVLTNTICYICFNTENRTTACKVKSVVMTSELAS